VEHTATEGQEGRIVDLVARIEREFERVSNALDETLTEEPDVSTT
jgi:hypothetical protein